MVRFLEANGYDVSYQSGIDTDRHGSLLLNHKTFLSVGHDEYWSGNQRANVEAARDAGREPRLLQRQRGLLEDPLGAIDRRHVHPLPHPGHLQGDQGQRQDRPDRRLWTGTWRDPRFSPPSDGGRPENGLTGTLFMVQGANDRSKCPRPTGKLRLWRNTAIATQASGGVATLPLGTLGYEYDEDPDNGFRPAGLFDLSSTTSNGHRRLARLRHHRRHGTVTHHLTTYRASSGALVFSAGTIQWAWGLDDNHDGGGSATRPAHAAGHRQHPGRHGRPARHAHGRAGRRRPSRPTRRRRSSTITSPASGRGR